MTILDTNVLSEVLKPEPSKVVFNWLAAQEQWSTFTTAVTKAEILYGLSLLPAGKKRTRLSAAIERMFDEEFEGRILPFDENAAREYATIAAGPATKGRPISQFDAQIAAIARSHRAVLATRNVTDFEGCGIDIVNPWAETAA
jgi:toxin FitB